MKTSRQLCLIILLFCLSACVAPTTAPTTDKASQASMHLKLAMAHLQNNNPTYALRELLQADKLDPQNSEIHEALAQAYQKKKAYAKAEEEYLQALQLNVDNPRLQNNLASLYLDMQQWDKAIEYFDKAAANLLFLNVHIAVTGRGYAYLQKGDYQQALNSFREALSMAPRFAPAYFHQSEVYRRLEDKTSEKLALEKSVEVAPGFLEARYRLAELLVGENDMTSAKEHLQQIVKRAPLSDWGTKAAAMLKVLDRQQ